MSSYRPNVALLLLDPKDRLLVCERIKVGGAWQFPQGGLDEGETPLEGLQREVREEIGLPADAYEVLESRQGYTYDYPEGIKRRKGTNYKGQTQTYYLCRLREEAPPIDVKQQPREFRDYRWIKPHDFKLHWLPEFKHQVYRRVLRDFFGVDLR